MRQALGKWTTAKPFAIINMNLNALPTQDAGNQSTTTIVKSRCLAVHCHVLGDAAELWRIATHRIAISKGGSHPSLLTSFLSRIYFPSQTRCKSALYLMQTLLISCVGWLDLYRLCCSLNAYCNSAVHKFQALVRFCQRKPSVIQ